MGLDKEDNKTPEADHAPPPPARATLPLLVWGKSSLKTVQNSARLT